MFGMYERAVSLVGHSRLVLRHIRPSTRSDRPGRKKKPKTRRLETQARRSAPNAESSPGQLTYMSAMDPVSSGGGKRVCVC